MADMNRDGQVKVWDIGVRIFHWSLVVLFTVAYLSGDEMETLHEVAGYGVLVLLAFRLVWGVIGSKYARFSDFIYGPKAVLGYAQSLRIGKPIHYLGHNPLGGWMVIALLLSLLLTTWTGLELYATEGKGPLASLDTPVIAAAQAGEREHEDDEGGDGHEFWEEVHEFFSNLTLLLVFVHIGGVVLSSIAHRENLARAMVTGYKKQQP